MSATAPASMRVGGGETYRQNLTTSTSGCGSSSNPTATIITDGTSGCGGKNEETTSTTTTTCGSNTLSSQVCGYYYGNWNGYKIYPDGVAEHDVYADVGPGCGGSGTARGTWTFVPPTQNTIVVELKEKDFLYMGLPPPRELTIAGIDPKTNMPMLRSESGETYEFRQQVTTPEAGHRPLIKERPVRQYNTSQSAGRPSPRGGFARGSSGFIRGRGRGSGQGTAPSSVEQQQEVLEEPLVDLWPEEERSSSSSLQAKPAAERGRGGGRGSGL